MGTLANGIKDIFSTSKTTATHLPVCASDGTPQGRISVGDLASVLGVPSGQTIKTSSPESFDADTTPAICILYRCSNFTNTPTANGILLNIAAEDGTTLHMFQFFHASNGGDFIRGGYGGHWSNWGSSSSFGNKTLDELYTALGLATFYKNYNNIAALTTAIGNNATSDFGKNAMVRFKRGNTKKVKVCSIPVWAYCVIFIDIFDASTPQNNHKMGIFELNDRSNTFIVASLVHSNGLKIYSKKNTESGLRDVYVLQDSEYPSISVSLLQDPSSQYPTFTFDMSDATDVDYSTLEEATIVDV